MTETFDKMFHVGDGEHSALKPYGQAIIDLVLNKDVPIKFRKEALAEVVKMSKELQAQYNQDKKVQSDEAANEPKPATKKRPAPSGEPKASKKASASAPKK